MASNAIIISALKWQPTPITTNSDHNKLICDNVLDQKFNIGRPNESWISDITYIWMNEGGLYLAGVKDLYTKEMVGHTISKCMPADLVWEYWIWLSRIRG